MKPIGGFIPLELPHLGAPYHDRAIGLSTGRACVRLMLQLLRPRLCYLPFYTCDSLVEPFEVQGIPYKFYEIDAELSPEYFPTLAEGEYFLYINYYGVKTSVLNELRERYGERLLIDNTHAFFEKGYPNNWSFTSARKYFGVPDGAYLYPPEQVAIDRNNFERFEGISIRHLAERLFGDPEQAYTQYVEYEESLTTDVKQMSAVSEKMLNAVDYEWVIGKRRENFNYLHRVLGSYNRLKLNPVGVETPFRYPFLPERPIPRGVLVQEKLFIPAFWPDTRQRGTEGFELSKQLSANLLPLPNDHRYSPEDLERLADFICAYLGKIPD
jgi:hypothetical protein